MESALTLLDHVADPAPNVLVGRFTSSVHEELRGRDLAEELLQLVDEFVLSSAHSQQLLQLPDCVLGLVYLK